MQLQSHSGLPLSILQEILGLTLKFPPTFSTYRGAFFSPGGSMSTNRARLVSLFTLFTALQPTANAGELPGGFPGGFHVQVERSANGKCASSLLKHSQFVQGQMAVLFQSAQRWNDPQFWESFVPVLKKAFPGAQIFIDSRNSAFAVTGGEELLGTRVILTHPQAQIRVEWAVQGVALDTEEDQETAESDKRVRRHYWDAPTESDPASGRTRWDSEASDETVAPRGTSRGNRAP